MMTDRFGIPIAIGDAVIVAYGDALRNGTIMSSWYDPRGSIYTVQVDLSGTFITTHFNYTSIISLTSITSYLSHHPEFAI